MGMAVELKGTLKASRGKGQPVELVVEEKKVFGPCDLTVSVCIPI
jgi:aspartyl/asparaginyl-tRNA synthetase